MKICGFQKMTLLDYPGKVACTVFAGGCNLRCPFCHNALLVTEVADTEEIDPDYIFDYLKKRQGILEGVALTGGEPLLYPDAGRFIEKVRALGYAVKLDTNGTRPEHLKELVNAGLVDYVAIDVKNSKEKYGMTVGIPDFSTADVEESIGFLLSGKVPYEFRTTVVREFHTPEDIGKIGQWIEGADRDFLQKFVDSGNLIGENLHEADKETMTVMKDAAARYVKNVSIRGMD